MRTLAFIFAAAFLLSCGSDNGTVEPVPVFNISEVPDTLYSSNVNDVYQLYYHLPLGYNHMRAEGYPVIYLLDGDYHLYDDYSRQSGGTAAIVDSLHQEGFLPECIIVGIGYKYEDKRHRDFLYPYDDINYESGGGDKYYFFLKDELIPFIDSLFNTSGSKDRTLLGYSAGGNEVMYAMFQYNESEGVVFEHYLAGSPRVYYHDYYILEEAERCFARNPNPYPFDFYLGRGDGKFELSAETMNNFLYPYQEEFLHQGDRFKYEIFPNVNHAYAAGPSFYYGLKYLFTQRN